MIYTKPKNDSMLRLARQAVAIGYDRYCHYLRLGDFETAAYWAWRHNASLKLAGGVANNPGSSCYLSMGFSRQSLTTQTED